MMNDNYAKFKFEIQLLHTCYESNRNSVYMAVDIRFTLTVVHIYLTTG